MPEISYLLAVPVSQSDRTDVNKRTFVICLRQPAVRSGCQPLLITHLTKLSVGWRPPPRLGLSWSWDTICLQTAIKSGWLRSWLRSWDKFCRPALCGLIYQSRQMVDIWSADGCKSGPASLATVLTTSSSRELDGRESRCEKADNTRPGQDRTE